MSPIALEGTLTCIGLPLVSLAVDLDDEATDSMTIIGSGGASSDHIGMAVTADDGEDEDIEDY